MNGVPDKFLIGLGAVVVLGAGALGYLTWSAAGEHARIIGEYETTSKEYLQLERLPLYPNNENLKKLEELKESIGAAGDALEKQLGTLNIPIEPISPEQFQDKLRATVSAVAKKAQEGNVTLPEKFYLGFDRYQSEVPKAQLAPYLWRQLKAVELAITTLIDSKVSAITALNRPPLPGEDGAAPAAPTPAPAKKAVKPAKPAAAAPTARVVSKYPFDIEFTSEQTHFRRALNDLVGNTKQFFIVQPLLIQNQNPKTTPKMDLATPVVASAAEGGAEAPAAKERDKYFLGTEKLDVLLRVQMVIFEGGAQSKPL